MLSVSENYIIGIDISPKGDETTLTVSKHTGSRMMLVNVIQGSEAEDLYCKLTRQIIERSSNNE